MNPKKLSIRFVILKAKINKKGVCAISCRLTCNGTRKAFSTGLFVNPKEWNAKKQLVENSEGSMITNAQLEVIIAKLRKTHLFVQLENSAYTVEDIFQKYLGKPTKKEEFVIRFFRRYTFKLEKLIGKDLELATWKKYNYSCNQVEQFIWWKYKKKDYPLEKLKLQFLIDFEYYLKTELNQAQVTINKTIQRLKKPIKEAVNEGFLDKYPFGSHKPKRVVKEIVFLSVEELKNLEEHIFKQPRLKLVKDLFIFCCYTGLAYNEMFNLKYEHIVKGFDGNDWIQMQREKTNKLISVPLLVKAKFIMEKHRSKSREYILPRFSNQKINSYLKEIGSIVGIQKRITHHTARKTFASTVLLYNNVPMEIVSELLGHSSLKMTQDYYGKIVQKKVAIEIQKLSQRLKIENSIN